MDGRAQACRVIGIHQSLDRDLHEVRIAQIKRAVAEGAAHRFHHQVHALGLRQFLQVPRRQHLQHFGQGDAARRRWRRGHDLPAVISKAQRFALPDLVSGEFLRSPAPAFGLDPGQQALGGFAAIEAVVAARRQPFQGARQFGLAEQVAFLWRLPIAQEDLARAAIAFHHRAPLGVAARQAGVYRESVARDADRGRQRLRQRQAAELGGHMHQPGGQAGNPCRPWPVFRAFAVQVAVLVQISLRRGCGWRGLARVDEYVLAGPAIVQQEEAAAAQAGADRLHHRQHRRHRHRGIEGVAAFSEHLHARIGRQSMGGRDGCARRLPGSMRIHLRPCQQRRHQQHQQHDQWAFHGAAPCACSAASFASSCRRVSGCSGSGSMHSTGQTTTHWGSS